WTITTRKAPICNAGELDIVATQVAVPVPEMLFGNNRLTLRHDSGLALELNAVDALKGVDATAAAAEGIKVAYAEDWSRKSAANHDKIKDVVKPYDWTYTTSYAGTLVDSAGGSRFAFEPSEEGVDIERLKLQEPILFYEEMVLFEDELADNGTAMLTARVRVMPSCFFILMRFFLRVDDVLFRINDTRIYHEYRKPNLIREFSSREAPFAYVRQVRR
ncbi:TIP41-like protein, partial [Blyttiomyces helicus]